MDAKKTTAGLVILLLSVLLQISCKEDKTMLYSGETNIYFSLLRWSPSQQGFEYIITDFPVADNLYSAEWKSIREARDSIVVSLALDGTDEGERIELVPVSITGDVAGYDREIGVALDAQITTAKEGRDFSTEAFVPAGKTTGAIAVRLNRASFRDTTLSIGFRLVPNEHFQTNYREIKRSSSDTTKLDLQAFKLVVTSILVPPQRWSTLQNYFGPFSRKKIFLVLQLTGGNIEDMYTNTPSLALMIAWAKTLKAYLQEQKNNGNTIYEEDGVTEMVAGKSV